MILRLYAGITWTLLVAILGCDIFDLSTKRIAHPPRKTISIASEDDEAIARALDKHLYDRWGKVQYVVPATSFESSKSQIAQITRAFRCSKTEWGPLGPLLLERSSRFRLESEVAQDNLGQISEAETLVRIWTPLFLEVDSAIVICDIENPAIGSGQSAFIVRMTGRTWFVQNELVLSFE